MEHAAVSDAELSRLARSGDVAALAGLLERHRPSLYASAVAVLRDREEALDAVQETFVVALVRIGSLRDPEALGGWLHTVLRNTCLMRMRRGRRQASIEELELASAAPGPEEALDRHAARDWVWAALDALTPDDRLTVILRYFTRCSSYQSIAAVTAVPVGTVRSRLNRARSRLASALANAASRNGLGQAHLEARRLGAWERFYTELHEAPVPGTYRDLYSPEIEVADATGLWRGVAEWSAHEREAIALGVRARIVGLLANRDFTVLEIDFTNPAGAPDHCPPRSTFVHRLADGRSRRLDIHYV
ncbi:MAG TPA: sigma-70 family RNA polymerase sigma factor [Candidatus Dormibacteraeota bacterium]